MPDPPSRLDPPGAENPAGILIAEQLAHASRGAAMQARSYAVLMGLSLIPISQALARDVYYGLYCLALPTIPLLTLWCLAETIRGQREKNRHWPKMLTCLCFCVFHLLALLTFFI
ncbi:MAG: hypothetical protein LCH41_07125 [Armatimonadetes bacterium]|nr:hypothetical protein [Armatimonadota bacterium]